MTAIKSLREKIHLTQENVASQLGVGRTAVSMWENGSSQPRADILPELAKVLQCKIDDLYSEST
ncbi:MAG: helix-turn-helix transcriptional regulator [Clostridiales bacterium]|nr:helix-turn-helix transcriptional regulator [Clostridiales bacterium]